MPKFIIRWNAGYGDSHEIVEADDVAHAERIAYEEWRQNAEDAADYEAEPYTSERAVDLALEDEPDDEEEAAE